MKAYQRLCISEAAIGKQLEYPDSARFRLRIEAALQFVELIEQAMGRFSRHDLFKGERCVG
jgi:hypothetical protein